MTKIMTFTGNYIRQGSEFISTDTNIRLVISTRKTKHTLTQPVNFLLYRTSEHENKAYVSSLYHTGTGERVYNFDYQGKRYLLKVDDHELKVIERQPKDVM